MYVELINWGTAELLTLKPMIDVMTKFQGNKFYIVMSEVQFKYCMSNLIYLLTIWSIITRKFYGKLNYY